MSRYRLFIVHSAVAALISCLLAGSSSAATVELPVSSVSPTNGASIVSTTIPTTGPTGGQYPVTVNSSITGLTNMEVEISTSTLPGADGTLADDFVAGWGLMYQSDAFPGTYNGHPSTSWHGSWAKPGTYYMQFHATRNLGSPTFESQFLMSPIFTFTVVAPQTAPPAGSGDGGGTAGGLDAGSSGRSYARKAIRARYGSSVKASIDSCGLISTGRVDCDAHWRTKKYKYRGVVKLTEGTNTVYYSFRSVTKKKLKKK